MPGHTVDGLARSVGEFVEMRSWDRYHIPRDIAIAISVEAAELLELFKWRGSNSEITEEEREEIRMETADIVIFALSMANACGFDLGDAIEEKIAANERRYPVEKSKDLFG